MCLLHSKQVRQSIIFLLDFVFSDFLSSLYFSEMRKLGCWQGCHCAIVSLQSLHWCVMDLQHWCPCCKTEMRGDLLQQGMCVYSGSLWIYFVTFSQNVAVTNVARDAFWLLLVASFLDCNEISRLRLILCGCVCPHLSVCLNLECSVQSWGFEKF